MANRHEDDDEYLDVEAASYQPLTAVHPELDRRLRHTYVSLFLSESELSERRYGQAYDMLSISRGILPDRWLHESTSHSWARHPGGNGMDRKKRRSPPSTRRLERGRTTLDSIRHTGPQAGRRSSTKRRPEPSLVCAPRTATGLTQSGH